MRPTTGAPTSALSEGAGALRLDEAELVAVDIGEHDRTEAGVADVEVRGAESEEVIERNLRTGPRGRAMWKWNRSLLDFGLSGGPLHVIFGPVPSGAWIAVSSS